MSATPIVAPQVSPRQQYDGMHLLRALACFLVVLTHSAEYVFMRFSSRWTAAICYDALARCAVPIFLMITGYLLLDYEEPFWRFYRKRCIRVLLPFVAYCVLYLAVDHVPIASWLHRIYIGSVAPHFWYIYELIGIYLFLPFLRKIYIYSSKGERLTYVAFWLAWSIIFPTIQKFFDLRHSPIGIYHLDKFTGYTGYVFIGAVFKQYMRPHKPAMLGIYLLGSSCIVVLFRRYSIDLHRFYAIFIENLSPCVFLSACGLFCWLKDRKIQYFRKITLAISECSYGIYMLHFMLVTYLYNNTTFSGNVGSPWLTIPATAILVFGSTLSIIFALRKIPFLRRIAG